MKPPWAVRVTSCLGFTLEGISPSMVQEHSLGSKDKVPLEEHSGVSVIIGSSLPASQGTDYTKPLRTQRQRSQMCLLRGVESRVTEAPTRDRGHCFQLPRSRQSPGENSELMDGGEGTIGAERIGHVQQHLVFQGTSDSASSQLNAFPLYLELAPPSLTIHSACRLEPSAWSQRAPSFSPHPASNTHINSCRLPP